MEEEEDAGDVDEPASRGISTALFRQVPMLPPIP